MRVERGDGWNIGLGRYQDVFADLAGFDALITDPPYSKKTHGGQRYGKKAAGYGPPDGSHRLAARGLSYEHWTQDDVREFVDLLVPRCRGWFCAFTSHDLVTTYQEQLRKHDRYVFAPVACVQHAMNVRLAGDGPSNWTCYLVVARPKRAPFSKWGALPGAYTGPSCDVGQNALDRSKRAVAGGKPLWLMRAIVRDYTHPGDLVADPCAGGATTLHACYVDGRRSVGAECSEETFGKAVARMCDAEAQGNLFRSRPAKPKQESLL